MAKQIVHDSQTQEQHINRLRAAITDMDALAQEGFSEISAIASLALTSLEHPRGYRNQETIAQALLAIRSKADNINNCINFEAEEVGCNWCDPSAARRCEARIAAAHDAEVIHG